jgi:hypothetical protein
MERGTMAITLRPAILALALAAPPSHAQSTLEQARRLYESAGLAAQVQSIPGQFEQGLADYRGKMPDETIAALAEAGKKSFAAEALREEIVGTLAQKLAPADIAKTLAWLEAQPGKRITLAEESAAKSMTRENMQAYFEGEKNKPANRKRARLLAQLIEATKAVDIGASFIEAISLGIAVGMDATQPVEKQIGVANLRARLRAAMPPEKLRANVGAMLPPMYGYIYRGIRDAELVAYVRFNASAPGQRYNEAVTAALAGALTRASVRVGELLQAAPAREKV